MSGVDLCRLLSEPSLNELLDPRERRVTSPLRAPLAHYWINSSHNTYLENDQMMGTSTAEMYRRVLRLGCRCIELDMWDGPDGEPMITHGHTECTSVPLSRVLLAIAEEAFVASPYPLILSLENHLCLAQQQKAATMFKDAFRTSLLRPPADRPAAATLPSPEALRGKIVLKGKQLPPASLKSPGSRSGKSSGALHVGEERSGASAGGGATPRSATAKLPTPRSGKSSLGSPLGGSSGASSGGKDESGEVQTLHPDLHALLYLQTLKTTPGGGRAAPSHLMSSFEEVRATNLLKGEERSGRWRAHNERYLSRVYPAAARVDSSNFEPSPFWDSGVQVCALLPSHSSHSSHSSHTPTSDPTFSTRGCRWSHSIGRRRTRCPCT